MTRTRRLGSPFLPLNRYELAVARLLFDQHEATGAQIRAHCFPGRHAAIRRCTLRQLVKRALIVEVSTTHAYRLTEGGREFVATITAAQHDITSVASPDGDLVLDCFGERDDPAAVLRFYLQPPRRETGWPVGGFARCRWTRGVR
jgi:hypothetical protein